MHSLEICIFIIILSNDQLNFSTSTPPSDFHFHIHRFKGWWWFCHYGKEMKFMQFSFYILKKKRSHRNHGTKFALITTIVLRMSAKIWKLYCNLMINRKLENLIAILNLNSIKSLKIPFKIIVRTICALFIHTY